MKRALVALFALAMLGSSLMAQENGPDPWQKLTNRKGWILLTFVTTHRPAKFLWLATKVRVKVVTGYKVLNSISELPKQGKFIVLTQDHRLDIVNYTIIGEEGIKFSPAKQEQREKTWQTDIVLPKGSLLRVERVDFGDTGPGKMRVVYALVSPATR